MTSKIFFPFLCILIVVSVAGCVYQFGGASVYNATALTEEGKEFVKTYNVKYICSDVYGLYLADIVRSEGIFAIDVIATKDDRIQYKIIDQKYVIQLKLIPKFS